MSDSQNLLDELTGGAFSAPTTSERTACVRKWLQSNPSSQQMNEVYKALSHSDKGAAKPIKEKLDELKRAHDQDQLVAQWSDKAEALLALAKLNMADALAWQRDAAKDGAPLSKEPLASFKTQLADCVKNIEELQYRAQVQRESALLIAQRIDMLSTKPWRQAQEAQISLSQDALSWQTQAQALMQEPRWASVDLKFASQLEAAQSQLAAVWQAFEGALEMAVAAAADVQAALPAVPVWAEELRAARGGLATPTRAPKPKLDPAVLAEMRAKATSAVKEALSKLEQDVTEGHAKTCPKAAAELRQALKDHVKLIDHTLEAAAHAALVAAGELQDWQRWRADQIREELMEKAQALLDKPLGGRKQQEALRHMREQWKAADQGGTPNHALWKRFDSACNEAHKVVEVWLEKLKEQAQAAKAQRQALIDELAAWAAANQANAEWKQHIRSLHTFDQRWRDAGHLSEKAFAEMQPLWKAAMQAAGAPLKAAQQQSLARRKDLIEQAQVLGAEPQLRIAAVKDLQQHWQQEVHSVPLDRRQEQKLWDAFRKPIDEAFQRKTLEREKVAADLSEHDRNVLEASKALDVATQSGDVGQVRAAMAALENLLRGQKQAVAPSSKEVVATENVATAGVTETLGAAESAQSVPAAQAEQPDQASAVLESAESVEPLESAQPAAPAQPVKVAKPLIAMRGDDRPGMKKEQQMPAGRGDKSRPRRDDRLPRTDRPDRFEREDRPERGPRLGDAAFRAQRDAIEHAQMALKKLAAQAHGEALTRLLAAWEARDAVQVPTVQELGGRLAPAVRTAWTKAVSQAPSGDAGQALLRLEMAAELPTPAEHLDARRALQLQLLTRRNDPAPAQTWGADAAVVLGGGFDAALARRLQGALKILLRR